MKKRFQISRSFISILTVFAMLCTMFAGITVSADEATTKEPTHVFTTPRNDSKGVQIAWKNPTDTTLTKTEVYKINNFGANQTYTLVATDNAPVAGGYTYARDEYDTAYTASTYVYYKLVCTYADGSTTELVTYTDAFASAATLSNQFLFSDSTVYKEDYAFNNTVTTYAQAAGATLDWEDYSGTAPSVHIASSRTDNDRNDYSFYFSFTKMADQTPFKLKFKYKSEDLASYVYVQMPNVYANLNATSETGMYEVAKFTANSDGWLSKEYTMKAGTNTPWMRFIVRTAGDFWFDDLKIVLLDDDGNETDDVFTPIDTYANNYYTTNGRLAAPTVSDYKPYDGGAELIWNGVTGAKEYRVYKKGADESLSLLATVPAAQTSIKIDGLTNGIPYTYVVKTVDLAKEESVGGSEVTVIPAIPQVTQSEKEPYNVIATPRLDSKGVEVAWKNPTASTLVKTEVYRIDNININPTYTLVATDNAPVAGAYTYARDEYDTAYTTTTNVLYKLVCTFADGSSNEVSVYTNAYVYTTRADYPFIVQDVWGTTNGRTDAAAAEGKYWQAADYELDFDTYAGESGPSIHISSNKTDEDADAQLKYWLGANYIPKDSYAKISYKVKTVQPAPNSFLFAMWCGKEIERYTATTEWKTVSNVVRINGESDAFGKFFYFVIRGAGDFWIDDVEVYLCDENGTVTDTTNRATRPDAYFTDSYYAQNPVPAAPVVSNTEEHDSGVDISWGAVANATGYEVYEKAEDGAYYLRASVPADITTVRINNLMNNRAYDFVVKTMDVTTKGSAFSAVTTLTPIPDPFKLSTFNVVRSGNSLTVSANMTNGTIESGLSAQLILAVYEKGDVVSMSTVALSDETSIAVTKTETLSATITLPDDYTAEKYTVKAFMWDSITSLNPYVGVTTITVPTI